MSFFANLTLALTAGSAGIIGVRSLSNDARYKPLREKIQMEQAEYYTCLNCYRDYAYIGIVEQGSENPVTTHTCNYCGHSKP